MIVDRGVRLYGISQLNCKWVISRVWDHVYANVHVMIE